MYKIYANENAVRYEDRTALETADPGVRVPGYSSGG
jgi:hypothetical protein